MREETPGETTARLLDVIAQSEFEVLPDLYVFQPLRDGTTSFREDALACVRNNGVWSQLVPVDDPSTPIRYEGCVRTQRLTLEGLRSAHSRSSPPSSVNRGGSW